MNELVSHSIDKPYPKKEVSVIIVNYNTRDLLRNCIDSIIAMTKDVDYEVIVVDNDSHDGSVEMLRSTFPEVRVIEAGSNLGFGRANNLGMKHAYGDFFFLLNSDTLLHNDAISEFYQKGKDLMDSHEGFGVLGSILLGRDMKTCHSFGRFPTPAFELREIMAKYLRFLKDPENTHPPLVRGMREVDYVTGADMYVPRNVFEATDGFDPDFFMYCEEVEWQKRIEKLGLNRLIIEGPEIIHLEGGSDNNKKKTWSVKRLVNLYQSRKIYRKKHYNKSILPLFRATSFILDLPAILLTSILNRQKAYLKLIKLK